MRPKFGAELPGADQAYDANRAGAALLSPGRVGMSPARLRDSLAGSLWLIPMAFAVSGGALALITLEIDEAAGYELIPQALTGPASAAQTILTTYIAALVTLISIVLTVITVAVQLAMQQFSPRI